MENRSMMKEIVEKDLKPVVLELYQQIVKEGLALKLDGIPAYNPDAQFVGGMLINTVSYIVLELIKTEKSFTELGNIIKMASKMEMKTWGILGSLNGLNRLHQKGILEKIVDADTLDLLKEKLDFRTMVDVENHYAMTGLPTNYYGVAFNIARLREEMGWETEIHSEYLLKHLLEHIECYSGEEAFMDETKGEGRFDRYSIVISSELAAPLLEAGKLVPEKIRDMLKRSAQLLLQLANEEGHGLSYGRSIGVYGDTAVLGTFTSAAKAGLLSEEELEIAYGYSMRVMERVIRFWYDKDMKAINMWNHGRKTDNYRNKNRILGETLGIFLNLMNTYESWKKLGFEEHTICSDFKKRLEELDKYTYIQFSDGIYKRALAIVRDGEQVWMLPIVNGAKFYYDRDAYMPVPFQNNVLQGVPECRHAQLVPQLILENGDICMPIVYTSDISCIKRDKKLELICIYDSMCKIQGSIQVFAPLGEPDKLEGVHAKTCYTFTKGTIQRDDYFEISDDIHIKKVRLVLLTYSEEAEKEAFAVCFQKGILKKMYTEGYDNCVINQATDDGSYDTPQGRLRYEVVWEREMTEQKKICSFSWKIVY